MKEIYIKDGPSFRSLLSNGPLGSWPGSTLSFKVRTDRGDWVKISFNNPDKDEVVGRVAWIGKPYRHPQTPGPDPDPESQMLIVEALHADWSWHYLVFNFNTKGRGGNGHLFTEDEFFQWTGLAKFLFSRPPQR